MTLCHLRLCRRPRPCTHRTPDTQFASATLNCTQRAGVELPEETPPLKEDIRPHAEICLEWGELKLHESMVEGEVEERREQQIKIEKRGKFVYERQLEPAGTWRAHILIPLGITSEMLAQSNCDACDCIGGPPIAAAEEVPVAPSERGERDVSPVGHEPPNEFALGRCTLDGLPKCARPTGSQRGPTTPLRCHASKIRAPIRKGHGRSDGSPRRSLPSLESGSAPRSAESCGQHELRELFPVSRSSWFLSLTLQL
jgi:hypothetical protein